MKREHIIIIFIVLTSIITGACSSQGEGLEDGKKNITSETKINNMKNSDGTISIVNNDVLKKEIENQELRENLIEASIKIGMDPVKIKKVKKIDDWVAGERYKFIYEGVSLILYTSMDSEIDSIKINQSNEVYKKGYEPYNISDFIVDDSVISMLRMLAQDKVKLKLNHPETAEFPSSSWGYSRNHDFYSLSGDVIAQNSFGVKDKTSFLVTYKIIDDKAKLAYFDMGGEIVVNDKASLKHPTREKAADDNKKEDSENEEFIKLIEGELGQYGKKVTIGGQQYIQYRIPKGKYTVVNQVNYCKVYVAKNKLVENSDGYKESKIIDTIELTTLSQEENLTVKSGEHLKLTLNANVLLKPKE